MFSAKAICAARLPHHSQMLDEPEFFLHFVLARTRARQEVFVFILHLFTGMPQMVVAQRIRGEGFLFLGSRW